MQKWHVSDIKLVIHPDERSCVRQRFQNSGEPLPDTAEEISPTELPFALVMFGHTFTHIYLSATQEITNSWYDGGEETDHLFWVYLSNPSLRGVYGNHARGDDERLFDFFKMFGDRGSLSTILINDKGQHYILSWRHHDGEYKTELSRITETVVAGWFGVMTAQEFRTAVTGQLAAEMNAHLDAALSIPTDE